MALGNAYDEIVPVSFQRIYPQLAQTAGRAANVIQSPPVGEGHCSFTTDQILAGFDELTKSQ